jgi:hypothetical protein
MVGMLSLFRILQRIFSAKSILSKLRLTLFLLKPYVQHWTLSEFTATKHLLITVQYLCMMLSCCLKCGMKLTKSWERIRQKIITSRTYFTKIMNPLLVMKLYLITVWEWLVKCLFLLDILSTSSFSNFKLGCEIYSSLTMVLWLIWHSRVIWLRCKMDLLLS